MTGRLRWGILSTAKIGREHVVPALHRSERATVVALASRDQATAEAVATELGVSRAYGSYDALLADPDVDAVYLGLPNHLHHDWTLRCAEAGKHVLCEKPLAMSRAEGDAMVTACDAAGVVLVEAFMYRSHPSWRQAVALVRSGRLGEIRAVQSYFGYYNDDPANIRNLAAAGGGALRDIGCYCIDSARLLIDRPVATVRGVVTVDPASGVDVVTSGVLGFGGPSASFTVSMRAEPDQRVDVYGELGRLRVEIPFNVPKDRPTRLLLVTGRRPPADQHVEVIEVAPADTYVSQADAFAATVLDGERPVITTAESLGNLGIIDSLLMG
jgi:predicted dehydrogenase